MTGSAMHMPRNSHTRGMALLGLISYVRRGLDITVSQKYKDKTKRTVDRWKQKMLERYPPSGILNELDLSRFTIVDKHLYWTSTRLPKAGMHAHIISTNDGERVQLLLLRNPTVWDAKDKTEMLDYRIEFTDPWHNRGGYLDEVRISWAENIRYDGASGYLENSDTVPFNRGSVDNRSIGWKNINSVDSPVSYVIIFTDPFLIPENN